MFSEDQKQQFRTEGYLPVPEFWTAEEIGAMRADLQRLQDEGLLRNVATAGDGETPTNDVVNLQLCPMSPHSRLFRAMPFADKAVEAVNDLIGSPTILHLDQVFLKPGKHGMGTNWHQDNAYFKISDPLMGTALWTAVHDATAANGTLKVIPRAFRQKLEHSRDPNSNHHIRCYPDESQAVTVELPAGGVVFFAYGTPHSTGGNNTDTDRAGVALHFLRSEYAQAEQLEDGRSYSPYVSGPMATSGETEYGERMDWKKEVAESLQTAA